MLRYACVLGVLATSLANTPVFAITKQQKLETEMKLDDGPGGRAADGHGHKRIVARHGPICGTIVPFASPDHRTPAHLAPR